MMHGRELIDKIVLELEHVTKDTSISWKDVVDWNFGASNEKVCDIGETLYHLPDLNVNVCVRIQRSGK